MKKEENQKDTVNLDKDGIPKVMSTGEYIGDACGMAASNCLSQMCSQLTYFYTEKIGMSATSASMAQTVATLADGVSDIIMGRLVDKTNTKEGKCRPWLKWMIFPLLISIILLTTVPKASPMVQSVYASLSIIFCRAIVYTGIMIPYYSMINFMTKSMEERGKIGNYRGVFNNAVGVIFGILIIPVTNALGGTQKAWIIFASILSIIASILLTVCYKCTKERYRDEPADAKKSKEAEISTLKSISILFHNKYWVLMLIAQFALFVIYVLQGASLPYYCKYIQGNDNLMALVNMIAIIAIVVAFLIVPILIKRIGSRNTGIIGILVGIVGTVIRMMNPTNMTIFIVGHCMVIFATSVIAAIHPALLINTCEWNEYKYGYKIAGMTNSASSFGGKIGAAFGQVLLGMILTAGGYNQLAETQSASALNAICKISIDVIGIFMVIILICFVLYTFDKKYAEIYRENQKRNAASAK